VHEPNGPGADLKLRLLQDIIRAVSASFDLDEVLDRLLNTVGSVIPYDAAGIFVLSKAITPVRAPIASHVIAGVAQHGFPDRPWKDDPMLKSGKGIVGDVIRTGTTAIVPDVRRDPRYVEGRAGTLSEIAVPIAVGGKAIGALNLESDRLDTFTGSDAEILEFISSAASIAIERALLNQEILEKRRIENQLEVAREVQASLLPKSPPEIPGFETVAVNIPSIHVSGDYYDYIPLSGGRIGIVVADVAGKGVPAALTMASFCAALRTQLRHDPDLPGAVTAVNAFLVDTLGAAEYVTAFGASLNPEDGHLAYVNCGHNRPLLIRADGPAVELDVGGIILGHDADTEYRAGEARLSRGDLLALYTDGVVEAMDATGEQFGVERLDSLLQAGRARPVEDTAREIIQAARTFTGSEHFDDDVTLLLLRRREAG
jgi:sigma-B regulation protein RsbU (phosphoserine phosphatase)